MSKHPLRPARLAGITLLLLLLALPLAGPDQALALQETPLVVILPIDRAQFLPGALFDLRVEVHAEALPADLAVTVNGNDASHFFGADATAESWQTSEKADAEDVQALTWRDVSLPAAGVYTVSVVAGGAVTSVVWTALEPAEEGVARNVILFVGDGMTVPMLTAARLLSVGNTQGKYDGAFAIDAFEEFGLVHTSSVDSIITDSSNAASALNTGHKGSIYAMGVYADSSPDALDDPRVETLAELAKRLLGKAIGVVTTAEFVDATPAAVWSHTRDRDEGDYISAAPLDSGLLPEVILGGGARWLAPENQAGSARGDERNLLREYQRAGYATAATATELATELADLLANKTPGRLLGLFNSGNLDVWLDRNVYTDTLGADTDQPGLVAMTLAALEVLNRDEDGFYLMVEAANIDKTMHVLDWERSIAEIIELDQAVAAAVAWAQENAPDTLIVVTSDHGHGFDVYGTVDTNAFNAAADDTSRRAAIRTNIDAGFPTFADADGDGFPDDWLPAITLAATANNHPDYSEDFQTNPVLRAPSVLAEDKRNLDNPLDDPAGIPLSGNLPYNDPTGRHTLQDVPVFASGPGAAYFGRVLDNTEIFFGLAAALGINPLAAPSQ